MKDHGPRKDESDIERRASPADFGDEDMPEEDDYSDTSGPDSPELEEEESEF